MQPHDRHQRDDQRWRRRARSLTRANRFEIRFLASFRHQNGLWASDLGGLKMIKLDITPRLAACQLSMPALSSHAWFHVQSCPTRTESLA